MCLCMCVSARAWESIRMLQQPCSSILMRKHMREKERQKTLLLLSSLHDVKCTVGLSLRIRWECQCVFVFVSLFMGCCFFSQDSGDVDSSINRVWYDKMNHINEHHSLLTSPSCFSSSHPPFFYGEPVQRLNCHCTVRPWQAALIHDAVAPLLIHPAREDVL